MPLAILEVQANGLPCVISDRVPKDVFQTDLLSPLPLEDSASQWADALLSAALAERSALSAATLRLVSICLKELLIPLLKQISS